MCIRDRGNSVQIQGDFTEEKTKEKIKKNIYGKVDVVMSDMAVDTTGIKNIDSIQTGEPVSYTHLTLPTILLV